MNMDEKWYNDGMNIQPYRTYSWWKKSSLCQDMEKTTCVQRYFDGATARGTRCVLSSKFWRNWVLKWRKGKSVLDEKNHRHIGLWHVGIHLHPGKLTSNLKNHLFKKENPLPKPPWIVLIFPGSIFLALMYTQVFPWVKIYRNLKAPHCGISSCHLLYTGGDPTWTKIRLTGWDGYYIYTYYNKDMQVGYIYYIYSVGFCQSTVVVWTSMKCSRGIVEFSADCWYR